MIITIILSIIISFGILHFYTDYTIPSLYHRIINIVPFSTRHRIKRIFCRLNLNLKKSSQQITLKDSQIVLDNSMSLNDYLGNTENKDYISKYKIKIYKAQLKALKREIDSYLMHTNDRISVEHIIMFEEIKEKLKKCGYVYVHRNVVNFATESHLEAIRQAQMVTINNPIKIEKTYLRDLGIVAGVSYITDEIRKKLKTEYLEKHNLMNDETLKNEYLKFNLA